MSTDLGGLTREQVDAFAGGLYWLAGVDGIEDSEVEVIREFLTETGSSVTVDDLQSTSFDPRELPVFLDTSFLRRLFLKSAVALVRADGALSEKEKAAFSRTARLLGQSDLATRELLEEAGRSTLAGGVRSARKERRTPLPSKAPRR